MNRKLGILFLISVLLAFLAGYFIDSLVPSIRENNAEDMISFIEQELENYYYYDLDDDMKHQAYINSIRAAIDTYASLNNDPYTRLISAPMNGIPRSDESFIGFGISFIYEDEGLLVNDLIKNSPAIGKLIPGDMVIGLRSNNEDIYFYTITQDEVYQLLSGNVDETKTLIVKTADDDVIYVDITLSNIETPTVYTLSLNQSDIAYIKIDTFSQSVDDVTIGSAVLFDQILRSLEETILNGQERTLILDLRDNPGGALSALHNSNEQGVIRGIVQQLLPLNTDLPLFSLESYAGIDTFYGGLTSKKPYDIKVLVNEHSASAAEVLAAALKVGENYTLYGSETFGKGVYQNQRFLFESRGVNYYLSYTEGPWFYGDRMSVIDTPLEVEPITQQGIKTLSPMIYPGEMSLDQVSNLLSSYQKFLNIYFNYEGLDKLRTDGYFDQKTADAILLFTTLEHTSPNSELTRDVALTMDRVYRALLHDLSNDHQLNELIGVILSS